MSIPYEQTGRVNQKSRTRSALVEAARELLAEGENPTVELTAERAGISRTTAYRYFPNQYSLIVATYPDIERSSLLGPDSPAHPLERLDEVVVRVISTTVEREPELRAQLRISLDPQRSGTDLPLRQGRVISWLHDALAPLREVVAEDRLHRLVLAVRATIGIEALVWLVDVGGVSREEAAEIMRESAACLARCALAEDGR